MIKVTLVYITIATWGHIKQISQNVKLELQIVLKCRGISNFCREMFLFNYQCGYMFFNFIKGLT